MSEQTPPEAPHYLTDFAVPGGGEAPPPARPAPGARIPAAGRVALYLFAWFMIVTNCAPLPLLAYAMYVTVGRGGSMDDFLNKLTDTSRMLEWFPLPLFGLMNVLQLALTVGVTLLFTAYVDGRPFRSLGFERVPGLWRHWALGFGIEGLHFALIFLIGAAAGWYQVTGTAGPLRAVAIFVVAVLIALPAAATEEVLMRGYVHQALERRYGLYWAVGVNSVIFALLHSMNPSGFRPLSLLGLVLAGIYLSIAYVVTRQLWLAIAAHTAWNVFEGPVFGLPVSGLHIPDSIIRVRAGGPELWTGGAFGPEAGLVAIFTTAVFSVLLWHAARRLLPHAEPVAASPAPP